MFKSVFVEGINIDEVWFKLLVELCKSGRKYKIDSGSFAGSHRLEFDMVSGTIHKPIEYSYEGVRKPLAVTVPEGCIAPTTDADIEEYFTDYLMNGELGANDHYKYATWIVGGKYNIPQIRCNITPIHGISGYYDPTKSQSENLEQFRMMANDLFYPAQNRDVIVPNQIQWCIDHYKQKGFGNNHCCIQVGYPESNLAYDVPYTNETERQTSPCMRLIDTKIIKDNDMYYLNFNVYFRSWDCYAGFPVNLGGLALLMEYMAGELEVYPGALSFSSKGLHVYSHSIDQLMMRSGIEIKLEN